MTTHAQLAFDVAVMSARALQQPVLRSTKGISHLHAFASRERSSLNLSLTPRPSSLTLAGATAIRTRFFHHTPAHRLFESPDAVVAACLGAAAGVMLFRYRHRLLDRIRISIFDRFRPAPLDILPISWIFLVDRKTRDEVAAVITASFEVARKAAKRHREQTFREASFRVPLEAARLMPGASHFELEEMGPMPSLPPVPKHLWHKFRFAVKPPFDLVKDARAFLYHPNGAPQVTAAFLAINADLEPPELPDEQLPAGFGHPISDHKRRIIESALYAWMWIFWAWMSRHPDGLDRIGTRRLPVTITYRGNATGCIFNPETQKFEGLEWVFFLISLTDPIEGPTRVLGGV
ncbi:hypothetical protein Daus18300_013774 [Diaporthe australafricana]|uniref:Uncharacterized protein n=1 Tax=Diaporthe australafricana TaxID=127596 RepID=A0ABR3VXU0_9PEZI